MEVREVWSNDLTYATKLDLSTAYWHVPISPLHRKFFVIRHFENLYEFNVLPYGVSSAPWTFVRCLGQVLEKLRSMGIILTSHIDDILILGHSVQETHKSTQLALTELDQAGFLVNLEKSNLIPKPRG